MTVRLTAAGIATDSRRPTSLSLVWLGQAGFLLQVPMALVGASRDYTLLLDPYLSDSLARKYAGTVFPHTRLMPVPIAAEALPPVDLVLCSHKHADHMDPGTLPVIAETHVDCCFVVPTAWLAHAADLGVPRNRLLGADANVPLEPLPGLRITPVLAAHETLEFDEYGHSHHLGYVVSLGGIQIYHSGDCAPYQGQQDVLSALAVNIALLPINGRDLYRLQRGVPGNFHPQEAVDLATTIGADVLVGHHFGMFSFNTVNETDLLAALRGVPANLQWLRPEVGARYDVHHV